MRELEVDTVHEWKQGYREVLVRLTVGLVLMDLIVVGKLTPSEANQIRRKIEDRILTSIEADQWRK